jgi:hypothetical protein
MCDADVTRQYIEPFRADMAEFRAQVREVLLAAAQLPMCSLDALLDMDDSRLHAHMVASGHDAVEVALTIANRVVGAPHCAYQEALEQRGYLV